MLERTTHSSLDGLPLATVILLAMGLVAFAFSGAHGRRTYAAVPSSGDPLELAGASGFDPRLTEPRPAAPSKLAAEIIAVSISQVAMGPAREPVAPPTPLSDALGETALAGTADMEPTTVLDRGAVVAEGGFVEGVPQGPWRFWRNGNEYAAGEFDAGLPDGAWMWWHENGRPRVEGAFELGLPEGTWQAWYESGAPMYETGYESGAQEGLREEWWENGETRTRGEHQRGLRNGRWTTWYPSGAIRSVREYASGLPEGTNVQWHENGRERLRGRYRRHQRHGRWTEWFSNGQLKEDGTYTRGLREGWWEFFDYDGVPDLRTGEYVRGRMVQR